MSVLHDPSHFVSRVLRLDKDQRLHCNVSIQRLDYFKEEEDIEVWEGCYDNSLLGFKSRVLYFRNGWRVFQLFFSIGLHSLGTDCNIITL